MQFKYIAFDTGGKQIDGTVNAVTLEVAITSLQRRNLVVSSIKPLEEKGIFNARMHFFNPIKNKDIVVLSRQISTLFAAQVSALRVFKLLSSESTNRELGVVLSQVTDDLQGGATISRALEKHPDAFSAFYVSMVRAGEESGKLDETFLFLADYLERNYELTSKAKNALIYPGFITATFVTVMILMMTLVVPRIGEILAESGQDLPIYTKIILGISNFLVDYWIFFLVALFFCAYVLFRFSRTPGGKAAIDDFEINIPYFGSLYRKFYLARITDNLSTMVAAAIPIVRTIEVTSDIVGNESYAAILRKAAADVRGGRPLSEALNNYGIIPGIVVVMIKVGEETGNMGAILKTLSRFYKREVENAVDTLVTLIEPVLIVLLGLGVALLLASVLIPIYSISSTI